MVYGVSLPRGCASRERTGSKSSYAVQTLLPTIRPLQQTGTQSRRRSFTGLSVCLKSIKTFMLKGLMFVSVRCSALAIVHMEGMTVVETVVRVNMVKKSTRQISEEFEKALS